MIARRQQLRRETALDSNELLVKHRCISSIQLNHCYVKFGLALVNDL